MNSENKNKREYTKYFIYAFIIIALMIFVYVIFKNPQMGVADQGDFDRVMSGSGL